MFLLPLFHRLANAPCTVIGGGTTAARKLQWLMRAGASLTIISPEIDPALREQLAEYGATIVEARYDPTLIAQDTRLIVSATNDTRVNAEVYAAAVDRGILVNCVDDPNHCTVTFPAIVDRFPLIVAIGSMGQAPALSRVVRGWIEQLLVQDLGQIAARLSELRDHIKSKYRDVEARTHAYNRLLRSDGLAYLRAGEEAKALELLDDVVQAGRVALVGAGPGDPDLITLKGLRAIQEADVVLYDKLANPALLEYARRDAELVFVGKQGPKPGERPDRPNNRGYQQGSINDLLLEHAQVGRYVVRLKGGDPFIYGRAAEEIDTLVSAGIEVTAIPGITAALGAASYAGVPLTHRDHAQSVRFVTGHRVENTINLDWPELGRGDQTLVIYMGLVGLSEICSRLIEHGAEASRPVALVENATLAEQRVFLGTLENAAALAEAKQVRGPTVTIVGAAAAMARPDRVTDNWLDGADLRS